MPPERRLAAILSADVAGYSRLMAEDEQGTIQTLNAYREAIETLVEERHRELVRPLVEQYHGELVDARVTEATPWL